MQDASSESEEIGAGLRGDQYAHLGDAEVISHPGRGGPTVLPLASSKSKARAGRLQVVHALPPSLREVRFSSEG